MTWPSRFVKMMAPLRHSTAERTPDGQVQSAKC